MNPRHHLPEALLMAHASGVEHPAVGVLVASHLVLCPDCRQRSADLEALASVALSEGEEAPVNEAVFDAILDRLDEDEPALHHPMPTPVDVDAGLLPGGLVLPRPILSLLGQDHQGWTTIVPGLVREICLPIHRGQTAVRLVRMRGGFTVPQHTHTGTEMNMVLAGGYHDADRGFERGDVQIEDEHLTHSIRTDSGEDCVLLAVNEGPLVPVGLKSKLIHLISGQF